MAVPVALLKRLNVNPNRIRSYILRLPLATRILLVAMVGVYIATKFVSWLPEWGALMPSRVGLQTMYRLNTYPFLHVGFPHLLFNVLAITPLFERFEAEYGTLTTFILFTGPMGSLPGGLYTIVNHYILRLNTTVMGASMWVFLLLSYDALKSTSTTTTTNNTPTHINIGPYRIPTWTTPLLLILAVSFLFPGKTSILGHLCGAGVGYFFGAGYLKYLLPPERILRWVELRLNLLQRVPHYVSVDQKVYGRYGILPSVSTSSPSVSASASAVQMGAAGERLGSAHAHQASGGSFGAQFSPRRQQTAGVTDGHVLGPVPVPVPAVGRSSVDTTPNVVFEGPGQRLGSISS